MWNFSTLFGRRKFLSWSCWVLHVLDFLDDSGADNGSTGSRNLIAAPEGAIQGTDSCGGRAAGKGNGIKGKNILTGNYSFSFGSMLEKLSLCFAFQNLVQNVSI